MPDLDPEHVKVVFPLEQDEDGYPPYTVENLWALRRADGFELDNIPWYAKGVASGDLINAQPDADGRLVFSSVIRRGGNSTLRVWLADAADCQQLRATLSQLGATSELNGTRFLSVDVPASAITAVWAYLEEGEAAGRWEFEVGHLDQAQP